MEGGFVHKTPGVKAALSFFPESANAAAVRANYDPPGGDRGCPHDRAPPAEAVNKGKRHERSASNVMWLLIVATVCAGLFAGAAIYINAVEHPARLSCGTELAVREFAPSYRRATVMQVPLAVIGCIAGSSSGWLLGDAWLAFGAILLIAVVPSRSS